MMAIESERVTGAKMLEEARRLRDGRDASERAFVTHLRKWEGMPELWRSLAPTFDLVLRKTDLCDPRWYHSACSALDVVPKAAVQAIGMRAATKVVQLPEKHRTAAIADMTRAAKKTGPLSNQKANELIRRYVEEKPRTVEPVIPRPVPMTVRSRANPTAIARELLGRYGVELCRDIVIALDAECARKR